MPDMPDEVTDNTQPIPLPPRTMERLRVLLAQRDALDGQIALVVETAAEALGVPAGWQIRDLAVGFEPPQESA